MENVRKLICPWPALLGIAVLGISGCGFKAGGTTPPSVPVQAEGNTLTTGAEMVQDAVWAYANQAGDKLITLNYENTLAAPAAFTQALSVDGKLIPSTYVKHQDKSPKSNGQDTATNFDLSEGYVYSVPAGQVLADRTVLLVQPSFLAQHKVLPFQRLEPTPLAAGDLARIQKTKNRKVETSSAMIELKPGRKLGFVLFERQGTDALASLVLITPEKLVFEDYPGDYNTDGTWHTGDEGLIGPEKFDILFALERSGRTEIAIAFIGAEGGPYTLFGEGPEAFTKVNEASRYFGPY